MRPPRSERVVGIDVGFLGRQVGFLSLVCGFFRLAGCIFSPVGRFLGPFGSFARYIRSFAHRVGAGLGSALLVRIRPFRGQVGGLLGEIGPLRGALRRFLGLLSQVAGSVGSVPHLIGVAACEGASAPLRVVLGHAVAKVGVFRCEHSASGDAVRLARLGHALTDRGLLSLVASHDHLSQAGLPASARQGRDLT